MRRAILAAIVAVAALTATGASPPPVQLTAQPDLAPGSQSFPRIAPPLTLAARKINGSLKLMDQTWLIVVRNCRQENARISRRIHVSRRGPHFLSLVEEMQVHCGGRHGAEATESHMYDLSNGAPVKWADLLPGFDLTGRPGHRGEERWGYFTSASMHAAYLAALSDAGYGENRAWIERCLPVLQVDDLAFNAYPRPGKAELRITPVLLPHHARACGPGWNLGPSDLRRIGADQRLIELVETVDP